MTNRPDMPSPAELWQQAGGGTDRFDRDEYRRLLRERGHLVAGPPEPLPCGWTLGGKAEEPHHAAARGRTDEEREALTPKFATGGFVESPVDGDDPPPWLTGCTMTEPKHTDLQRSAIDLMRERLGVQRADRAERAGQLDLGGQ